MPFTVSNGSSPSAPHCFRPSLSRANLSWRSSGPVGCFPHVRRGVTASAARPESLRREGTAYEGRCAVRNKPHTNPLLLLLLLLLVLLLLLLLLLCYTAAWTDSPRLASAGTTALKHLTYIPDALAPFPSAFASVA